MSREKAKDILGNIIAPFLDGLIDEIEAQEGYSAQPSGWYPGVQKAEATGITKRYPNRTEKTVSAFWVEGGHSISVGRKDIAGGFHQFPLDEFNEKEFRDYVLKLLS